MLRKWVLGAAVLVVAVIILNRKGTSPRENLLANSTGPVDADAPDEFTTTDSGLQYRILRRGEGAKPSSRDTVTVNYAGWLDNGRQFDSSYDSGKPATFRLDSVIAGWTEGVPLVSEGGMIELRIPSKLGYGIRGSNTIPPSATLNFIIELVKVQPAPEPAKPGQQDPDAPEEFTTADSGLKYRILRKSDGAKPTAADTVTVHYKGWLDDGTVFDSSYDRSEPTTFPLNGVIPGWSEGLTYVGTGGMIELEIPADLGYGPRGHGPIPPGATLHFIVELLEIQ